MELQIMGTLEPDLSQCQDTADSVHLCQDRIPHVGRMPVTKGLKSARDGNSAIEQAFYLFTNLHKCRC